MVVFHFHRSRGYELLQHPRGDPSRPRRGVFALRSPRRPNPIGLTVVDLLAIEGNVLRVRGLDAFAGTPVLDLKPVRTGVPEADLAGIDAFSSVAASYEGWFATPLGSFVDGRETRALERMLRDVDAGSIVEVGAGTGHIGRFLANRGSRVTAVEPSLAMREDGRRRTAGLRIRWSDARAEALPFSDGVFDGAVLFATLEFVHQPADALREALRVVCPEGWIIVGLLHPLSAWTALYRRQADRGDMPWAAARFFTRQDVETWMRFPAERSEPAVFLGPDAIPPFEEAERSGKRAGNSPALEILRWRKRHDPGDRGLLSAAASRLQSG